MNSLKIDPSVLMAFALAIAGGLAVVAAFQSKWDLVSMALTGLFAIAHVPVKQMPPTPPAQGDSQ